MSPPAGPTMQPPTRGPEGMHHPLLLETRADVGAQVPSPLHTRTLISSSQNLSGQPADGHQGWRAAQGQRVSRWPTLICWADKSLGAGGACTFLAAARRWNAIPRVTKMFPQQEASTWPAEQDGQSNFSSSRQPLSRSHFSIPSCLQKCHHHSVLRPTWTPQTMEESSSAPFPAWV